MSRLVYKLKRPKVTVKDWEKKHKFKISSLLGEIDKDIYSLLTSCPYVILSEAEAVILTSLKGRNKKYLSHEVLTWKLKSTINWIEKGDANTKFFHSFASTRRNFNDIWALQNENSMMVD